MLWVSESAADAFDLFEQPTNDPGAPGGPHRPAGEPQTGHMPFSPRVKSALERSRYESQLRGHTIVEPAHVLAAAAAVVQSLGVEPGLLRERAIAGFG